MGEYMKCSQWNTRRFVMVMREAQVTQIIICKERNLFHVKRNTLIQNDL